MPGAQELHLLLIQHELHICQPGNILQLVSRVYSGGQQGEHTRPMRPALTCERLKDLLDTRTNGSVHASPERRNDPPEPTRHYPAGTTTNIAITEVTPRLRARDEDPGQSSGDNLSLGAVYLRIVFACRVFGVPAPSPAFRRARFVAISRISRPMEVRFITAWVRIEMTLPTDQ